MKRIKVFEIIAVLVMLSLTVLAGISCGKAQADTTQGPEGITWVLKSYGDPANLTQAVAGKEVTLTFNKEKGEVSGNSGVNGYGSNYVVSGNQLIMTEMMHTMMASTNEALNNQENAFFKILGSAKSYNIEGERLTITGTVGTLVFSQK